MINQYASQLGYANLIPPVSPPGGSPTNILVAIIIFFAVLYVVKPDSKITKPTAMGGRKK